MSLEVVGLVDHEQPAAGQVLAVPVPQRRTVRDVGGEERPGQGGRLGSRVGTAALRTACAPAHALGRRDSRVRIALAEVVVSTLDYVEVGAEVALVLIL